MRHVKIAGTGSYVPEHIVTNDDLAGFLDTSDEWIASRTGIRERRISTGENTSDLAAAAAQRALEDAGVKAEELDLILCATISPDCFMPSVACMVQERIGASKAAAFDLVAACSGLVYGMATAAAFIESGMYRTILVIGAETLSKTVDWTDRATCVLFGDGAGAVVLTPSERRTGILASYLVSDGGKQDYLTLPALPLNNSFMVKKDEHQPEQSSILSMKGQDVFKFAVRSVVDQTKTLLTKAALTEEDIRYVVLHQANSRIIEQSAKSSGISQEKFFLNLDRYGNTSAASIGIALDELSRKGMLSDGDKLLLIGFGGGMTSGGILLEWSR